MYICADSDMISDERSSIDLSIVVRLQDVRLSLLVIVVVDFVGLSGGRD